MSQIRYRLADLTMVAGHPWFVVHAHDDGHTSSWIIRGELQDERFVFQAEAWVADAIQAIVGDADGQVWAITCEDELITNSGLGQVGGWQRVAAHPQLAARHVWFSRRIGYHTGQGTRIELADCLAWVKDGLLIGTQDRRIYRWTSGAQAQLEHEDVVVGDALGGINAMVDIGKTVYALGHAGLLLRRLGPGNWQHLGGPWPAEAADFVNLIAGVEGPQGELWAVAAGGSVIAVSDDAVSTIAQVAGEPLGITRFQRQWFVSTLEGCYELPGDGGAPLVRGDILMGKAIDAGACLIAFDVEPQLADSAAIHVWIRTRTRDRWFRQVVCRG